MGWAFFYENNESRPVTSPVEQIAKKLGARKAKQWLTL